jgi:hypothetical protein
MHFIGLLLVALALFSNLKAYPSVFAGKKKKAEQAQKFEEALEKMNDTPIGQKMTGGLVNVTFGISLFFSFLFYLITSIIVANPFMYALAVIIFLLNISNYKAGARSIKAKKFLPNKANKIGLPLKTLYIIGFFVLFFL